MMKKDPALGSRSFGRLARFIPERISVHHHQILQMENGGYKKLDAFSPYRVSLQGIHDGGVKDTRADYFEKTADLFIQRIRRDHDKHVVQYWLVSAMLFYLLGGDKYHSQQLCKWYVHYKDQEGVVYDDDELVTPFQFEDRDITLSSFHDNTSGSITLNLQSSMEYITSRADPSDALNTQFVQDNWKYILLMAAANEPIDLFDRSTWGDHDLEEFQYQFASQVCIHPTHQQLSESYVRALSLTALTGIGEDRRGNKIAGTSGFLRFFTEWAEDVVPGTKRLQGAKRAQLLLTYLGEVFQPLADRAVELLGGENKLREVKKYMKNAEKQSDVEREEGLETFKKGVESDYTVPTAEMTAGVDVTGRAGGRVYTSLLIVKNDIVPTPQPGQQRRRRAS